jgi:transposase
METTLTAPIKQRRPKGGRMDYAIAATMLASGLTYRDIAAKFGVTPASAKVGMVRRGVTKEILRNREATRQRAERVAEDSLSAASERLRGKLSCELEKTADKLSGIAVRSSLENLKRRAEVLEPLARTAKVVHDWGSEKPGGLVLVGVMKQCDPEAVQPSIEVASEVVQERQMVTQTTNQDCPSTT